MKIRIAVAVAADGRWAAYGHWKDSDDAAKAVIAQSADTKDLDHVVFVEADVPLPPSPQVVSGEVVT